MNVMAAPGLGGKSGFRDLEVVAKVRESSIITSFHLRPVDPAGWRSFKPGQFLVFRIPVEHGFVLRNYSVSSAPGRNGLYRITVKREVASGDGCPDGVGSCYLHDRVEVGDILAAEGPRGEFHLDAASSRPVVLLGGGVGLTPLVSMLHALASETDRRVFFIHACENGDVHALREEVGELARTRPGVTAHFLYRIPTETDRANGRHHGEGVVTRSVLQGLLPLDDYDVYMCGPPPFMKAVHGTLRSLGVPKHRIAYEFFGPATVLDADVEAAAPAPAAPAPPADAAGAADAAVTIELKKSGRTMVWDSGAGSLLDFLEGQGLAPDFSCRAGICSTCKTRLLDGEVEYFEEPLDELQPDEVLLCCSKATRSLVLDL